MKTIRWGAALVLSFVVAGCGGKSEKPAAPAGPEKAQAPVETRKPAEGAKGPYITAFRIGHGFGENGKVSIEGATFGPGEPVFLSFDVPNAPADGKVRVVVLSAADSSRTLREEEAPVAATTPPSVSFKIETKGWPAGDYIIRKSLTSASARFDNLTLGLAQFKIVKERPK
jgi:hypothetical protein